MPPAARVSDMHACPMVTGVVPHVGGPVLPPGQPTVLIGGLPAARVGDMVTCAGPPDVIAMGSPTVLIGYMMAARMGDPTVHGGVIVAGLPTVLIGDMAAGGSPTSAAGAGASSAASGGGPSPFAATLAGALGAAWEQASTAAGQQTTAQVAALREAADEGIATVESCPDVGH